MPIYEYACMECESHFDELVRTPGAGRSSARECGAGNVLRQLSTFAVAGVSSQPKLRRRRAAAAAAAPAAAARPSAARSRLPPMSVDLATYRDETLGCTRCALAAGRTQVVFGSGDPNADLMFVGEAPGFHEDQQGVPFVGQAGKLLDTLLAGIGLTRAGRLCLQCLEVPPAGEPRPAAGRDRGLRVAPLPPDRADQAAARRDARELRDEAALRASRPGSRASTAFRSR